MTEFLRATRRFPYKNGRATGPLAPCCPTNNLAELIRTGRGDEGEWGRDCSRNIAIPEQSEDLQYPTPLASPRPADVRSEWVLHRPAGRGDVRGDLRLRASGASLRCDLGTTINSSKFLRATRRFPCTNDTASGPLAPCSPTNNLAELIRTGRGDERGVGSRLLAKTWQSPRNPRILGTPLPLHPLAPRTFDPTGWCIAPRGEGTCEAIFGCGRAERSLRYASVVQLTR